LNGEEADTAELDLITGTSEIKNDPSALTLSENSSVESNNVDLDGCSVRSSLQTDITQPSDTSTYVPGHLPNSEAPRPGELDYLLDPTTYYGRLDDLEARTAQTVGLANGPRRIILTEAVPFSPPVEEDTQTMSEWPHIEHTTQIHELMKRFSDSLFNTSQALCHLNSEGFCGKAFSLLVEDQARPGIANIVHVSLDDIHRPGTLLTEYATILFERVIGLNYDRLAASWRATLLKYHLLGNLLPLALVSFTGSHVCRFDTNLWGQETDSIPVGFGYFFRPRELACLKDFIGGPAWVLGKSQPNQIQPGLKLSLVVQDLQELWGPVWLVGGTAHKGPIIRTERGFIVPLPRAEQPSEFERSGEIECHWTTEVPEYINRADRILLKNTSRILIGTESMSSSGLTVNPKCRSQISDIGLHIANLDQFQFPGTCNDYYTMEGHEIQLTGGQYVNAGVVIRHKRVPGRKHKEVLLSTLRNSKIDINPLLRLRVGLEISACTGNALRISLWEALRLSQTKEWTEKPQICNHEVADPKCIQTCWNRLIVDNRFCSVLDGSSTQDGTLASIGSKYTDDKTSVDADLSAVQIRQKIILALQALEHTGVDMEGNLQAYWPFLDTPTNHRILRTRFNKWLDIVADTRDTSTFAVISQRCLGFIEEISSRSRNHCQQSYLNVSRRTWLSLRVLPQPTQRVNGTRRINFGLPSPPESDVKHLRLGSGFRIGKRHLHVKKAWQSQQKMVVACTSKFDIGSRWIWAPEFREQLDPGIKGLEPIDVLICSKAYDEN